MVQGLSTIEVLLDPAVAGCGPAFVYHDSHGRCRSRVKTTREQALQMAAQTFQVLVKWSRQASTQPACEMQFEAQVVLTSQESTVRTSRSRGDTEGSSLQTHPRNGTRGSEGLENGFGQSFKLRICPRNFPLGEYGCHELLEVP